MKLTSHLPTSGLRRGVLLLLALTSLAHTVLDASTRRYRLSWRDNPSTSMVVGWETTGGSGATVYYDTVDHGTNWSAYANSKGVDKTASAKGMTHQFARLSGLQPDTAYYFVVRDSDSTSARYWFMTAPDSPQPFSIVAGGDSRNNRTPRQNANRIVSKLRPLFVAFGGDYTDSNSNSQWAGWFDDWQLTISSDGRMYPIVAARGNHDDNGSLIDMFDIPSSSVYYAQSFGGTLLRSYTLNSEITPGGSQGSWLANDLSTTGQAHTFRMAQYHKPMRPHTSSKSEGNSEYDAWAQTFYNNNMDLVVECDTHMVKRTWPVRPSTGGGSDEGFIRDDATGTVYVGEGCWGAPLRSANDAKNWTRNLGSFNQVQWIQVHLDKMEIRTINVNNAGSVGSVSDSNPFAIPSNLDIWNPSNGSLVTIASRGIGGGNIPPLFASDPISKPAADEAVAYSASIASDASDANGDSLSFAKVSGPSWLSVASNGSLSGTPGASDVGSNAWTVSVDDGNGGSDTATLNINVISVNGGGEFTVSFQQGVNGYNGTQDTYLRFASAGTNHGGQSDLQVDGADGGGEIHALIRFDNLDSEIPAGADVLSATLEISVFNPGSPMTFHRMLSNWSESSTWNSMGSGVSANGSEAVSSADVSTGSVATGTRSYDVTNSVTAWIENGQANRGWAFLPTGSDGIDFDSSESGNPPKLTVTYFSSGSGGGPTNTAPAFGQSSYSDNATQGQAFSGSMAGTATDSDGDSLTYSKASGPAWLNVAGSGALSGTPGSSNLGSNVFTIQVSDGTDTDTATLTVSVAEAPSSTPVMASYDFESGAQGWTNPDGTYGWRRDSGGTPSNSTGPVTGNSGDYYWYMETSNNQGPYTTASPDAYLLSPVIANGTDRALEFYYHMYGSTMGRLNVDISTNGGNSWTTGVWSISGQQTSSQTGAYTKATVDLSGFTGEIVIRFRGESTASSSGWRSDMTIDDVVVTGNETAPPPNSAPVFGQSNYADSATEGQAYSGSMAGTATDANGDSLAYSKASGPAWLSVASNGALSGTPGSSNVGSNVFTIQVSDGKGGTDTATLTIDVDAAPTGGGDFVEINFNNFESGWGIWNDGGSDCRRSSNDSSYAIGTYCVRLRDNTSSSVMTTDNLSLAGKAEIKVEFSYFPNSMDNSNEDFWLQISTNGGSSYTTVEEWNRGDEFQNGQRYNDSVTITGFGLNNNVRLRFRCDASANGDQVYIDEVRISAK